MYDDFQRHMNQPEDGFDGIARYQNISRRQQMGGLSVVREKGREDFAGNADLQNAV